MTQKTRKQKTQSSEAPAISYDEAVRRDAALQRKAVAAARRINAHEAAIVTARNLLAGIDLERQKLRVVLQPHVPSTTEHTGADSADTSADSD